MHISDFRSISKVELTTTDAPKLDANDDGNTDTPNEASESLRKHSILGRESLLDVPVQCSAYKYGRCFQSRRGSYIRYKLPRLSSEQGRLFVLMLPVFPPAVIFPADTYVFISLELFLAR